MSNIKSYLKTSRSQEIINNLDSLINDLKEEGLSVEFGKIGNRTNYAMIYDESHDIEVVGYTYIKDIKYYNENLGELKALQQAVARRNINENKIEA